MSTAEWIGVGVFITIVLAAVVWTIITIRRSNSENNEWWDRMAVERRRIVNQHRELWKILGNDLEEKL